MVTVNNEDLVKRIAKLARQNQELEDQIKKLLKQNEKLSKDNEKLKALYKRVVADIPCQPGDVPPGRGQALHKP